MLSVILSILKIIGIILLSILGLILLLFILVLFVPIRYKARVVKNEEVKGKGYVSWLFHIVHISVEYEQELKVGLRLFGISLKKKDKPRKEKKPKKKKSSKKNKASKKQEPVALEAPAEKLVEEPVKQLVEAPVEQQEIKAPMEPKQVQGAEARAEDVTSNEETDTARKKNILEKIKDIYKSVVKKIKNIYNKVVGLFKNIKNKATSIKEFFQDERVKKSISLVWTSLKKLIKHIRPRKIKGNIHFGFDDPSTTGKALGGAGLLYGIYGKDINIIPDFENSCFDCNIMVKGRIRLATVGILAYKVWFNDDFKYFRKNLDKLTH